MNPDRIRASYRRGIEEAGTTVTLRRYFGTGTNRPSHDYGPIGARVTDYEAAELVGKIVQGDRKVLLLAEDLTIHGFPSPVRRGDKIVLAGAELNVEYADDQTRRVAGVLIAYEIQARG